MAAMEAVPRMPMIWLDLKEAGDFQFGTSVKQFILKNYGEDPDNYNEQLKKLLQLRQSAVNVTRDFEGCSTLRKYFGQLHYLQSRVPMGPGQEAAVPVSWTEIFSGKTVSHDDISYEQACILYNLGALHSMLGAMDNRVSEEGMKVSCTHFQCSAGAFSYLRDHYSHNYSVDMSHQILNLNINLMLGQAQECLLEKSMLDNRKSFLVARISAQVVDYYKEACRALDNSETASMLGKIQKDWKKLVQMKIYYFAAIAHLHMGKQAEEQQKYGERLAYLQSSLDKLSEAMKLAKGQPDSVQEALRFSMDVIGGKFNSAKKDNDFIYHETVPALDTLPSVKGAPLVKALPVNPTDPTVTGPDIFCKLVPMAAHEASSLYSEEKAKLLRETMAKIDDKNETLEQFMDSLSLDPDAIDNMDMYSTIPPVVMEKCAALSVRPDTVKSLIQSMQALSGVFTDVEASLREIRDILDKDEAADRSLQEAAGKQAVPLVPASLVELRRDLEKYVEYQEKASFTNTELHRAMNLHISQLRLLGGPLDSLKDALPRPELSEEDEAALAGVKRMLGKVQEMREQRGSLEKQLRDLIQQDDITSALVTTERSDMKRVFEEQLLKYEQVKLYIEQNLAAQDNILKALTDANVQSAAARKTLSDTQHKWNSTVQTLVASYEAYEDLMKKSQEGKEFYEDLEAKVSKLLEKAKALCQSREEERQAVMERELQKKAPPQRPTAPKPPAKKPVDIDPNTIDDPELAELTAAILALGGDLPEELRSMPPEFALPHSALPAAAAAPGPLPGQVPGPGPGPGSAVHWPGPYAPPPMRFPPNLPSPELLARISAGFPQSLPPGAPLPHHQMPPQQLPQYPPPHPNAQAPPGSQPPPPPATAAAYTPRPSQSQPAPPPPVAPGPAPTPAPTQVRPSTTTVDSVQTPIASYSAPSPGQPHPQHQPQPQPQHHSQPQPQPQHQVPAPQRHPVPVSTGYAPAPQMGPYAHYMPQGVPSQQQQQPPQPQHFPRGPPTPYPVAPPQTAHFQPIPAQQMGPRPVPGPGHQLPVAPPQGQYQQYMPQQRHPAAAPPPNFPHAPLPPGQVPAPGMQPGVPHPHAHQHPRQQGYPPVSMVPGGHPSQVVPVSGVAQNHMPYLPHASQPMPPPASQPYLQQQQPQPQMQHPPPHMPMPHHMHHVAPGGQQRMPPPPQMQTQPQPPTSQPQMPPPGSSHPHMLPVSKQLSPPSLSQIPPAGHPASAHPSQVQLHAPQPLHPAMYQQTQHLPQAPRGPQVHMPPTSMPSQHMPPTSSMPPQQMPPTSMPGQHMPPTSMPSQPFMHPNTNGLPPQRHPQPPGPQSHPQMPPQGHMAQQPMPVPPHQPVPPHAHAHTGQVPAGYPGAGYVMRQPGPSVVPPQQQPQPQQQPPPPLTPQPMAPQQQHPPPPQPLAPQQMPPQPPPVSFTPTPSPAGMPPGLGQQQHPGAGAPAPGQAPQNIMTPTTGPVGAGPVAPSVLPSPAPSPSPSPGPSSLVMTPPQHPCPSPALTPGAVAPAPHPPPPPAPSSNSSSSSASSSSSSSSSSVPPPAAPPAPGDALFQRQNSSTDDLLSSSPESQHGGTKDNVLLPTKADPEEDGQRRKKSEGVRLIQGDPYQAPERVARLCTQLERFRNTVQSLEQPSSSGAGSEGGGVLSRLDGQWKELAERQEKEARQLSIAIARCYTMKNRHQDVMPYDRNRVVLRSGKDDYINASFIEELSPYCPRLIATQAPLTGTAADFWLMVYEQKVSVVVMLVSEQELEKQKVPHYFPSERGQQLSQGPITLTLTTQKTTPTHVERMISLQYRDQSLKRTVIHLQYTSWPELGLPDSKSSLIRFIQEVHGHYLHQRPLHTPIVVHCSSGVGRTGALCLLYAALQEVEAGNGIPDLTLLVRKMRQQRKNMLQEKLHLKFCYEALLKHAEQVLQRHGVATVPCSKTLNNATIKPYSRQECQTDIVLGGDLPISSIQATIAKLSIRPQSTSDSEGSLDLGPPSTATPDLPHQQEAPEGITTAHDPAPPQDPFPPSEAQPSSFSPPPPSISSSSSSPAKDLRSPSPPTNQGNGLMESNSEYPNHSAPALDAPVTETGTGTVSPPPLPAASASTLSSLDLLASMTPEAFTLDAACRGKQRFNKQSFLQPQEGQGLQGAPQGDDPLSNLDPLWTLNKT